jgi:hypothetical protein
MHDLLIWTAWGLVGLMFSLLSQCRSEKSWK